MTVLDRLVHNENTTTETLCGLMSYPPFREKFLAQFIRSHKLTASFSEDDVTTQMALGESGRSDLIIQNDDHIILVEVKIEENTALTKNQPKGYIKWLLESETLGERHLIFLLPPDYKHKNAISKAAKEMHFNEIHFLTWEDILKLIEDNGFDVLNPYFADFHAILSSWYRAEGLKFDYEEVILLYNSNTIKAITKLLETVKGCLNEFNKADMEIKESGTQRRWHEDEYGCYFKDDDGNNMLWFGIWAKAWKEKGFPIIFGVEEDWGPYSARFRKEFADAGELEGFYLKEIVSPMLSSENPSKAIAAHILKIVEKIKR